MFRRSLIPLASAGILAAGLVGLGGSMPVANAAAATPVKPPYVIGWSDIYTTPSWMTETIGYFNSAVKVLKKEGLIKSFTIANANGSTPQQIAQIEDMVAKRYNGILVDAGSATALNRAIDEATSAGIAVGNFDSLVTTTDLVTRVDTNQFQWGSLTAQWLVNQLHGHGKILVLNGPAGVSVSQQRWAGAQSVFKKYPGIKILNISNDTYNVAPAEATVSSLLPNYPVINGIWSQGGALSAGAVLAFLHAHRKIPPITGENYNQFLKQWVQYHLDAIAVEQPNWLGEIALYALIRHLEGLPVPHYINVPFQVITNQNVRQFVKIGGPNDYYGIKPISLKEIYKLIGGPLLPASKVR
ncbi:MAG: ABC transporter substrate-binding protein [Firmicutes bacterium]|nr:ABC transporter substrate-binding protein [Bacillota bacterium]